MADTTDPNAAPMHQEVKENFAPVHVAICLFLGVAATVAGVVLGLTLIND
jgi:hypothetical protein